MATGPEVHHEGTSLLRDFESAFEAWIGISVGAERLRYLMSRGGGNRYRNSSVAKSARTELQKSVHSKPLPRNLCLTFLMDL